MKLGKLNETLWLSRVHSPAGDSSGAASNHFKQSPRGWPVALGRPAARLWPGPETGPGRGPGPETGPGRGPVSGWGGTIVSRATIVLRAGVLLNTFGGAKFFNDLWCEERTCACWVSEETAPVRKNSLPETKNVSQQKGLCSCGNRSYASMYVRSRPKMTVRAGIRPRNVAAACDRLAR